MNNAKQLGFTLSEFLITTTMAAIVLSLAVPSFNSYIDNSRVLTVSSSFIAAIHLARNEAIKRGYDVGVCAASNASQTSCGSASDWKNGWLIFVDKNNDGQPDNVSSIIKKYEPVRPSESITSTSAGVAFEEDGMQSGSAGDFLIGPSNCQDSHAKPRQLSISKSGRISSTVNTCPDP